MSVTVLKYVRDFYVILKPVLGPEKNLCQNIAWITWKIRSTCNVIFIIYYIQADVTVGMVHVLYHYKKDGLTVKILSLRKHGKNTSSMC